jgi:hypothetical protein
MPATDTAVHARRRAPICLLPRQVEHVRTMNILVAPAWGALLRAHSRSEPAWLDAVGRLLRRREVTPFATIVANAADVDSLRGLIASTDAALPTESTRALRTLIGLPGAGARALEIALDPSCSFGTFEIWSNAADGEYLSRAFRAMALHDLHAAQPPRVFVSVEAGSEHDGFALADELAKRRVPYCLWRAHLGADLDERVLAALRFALLPSCLVA